MNYNIGINFKTILTIFIFLIQDVGMDTLVLVINYICQLFFFILTSCGRLKDASFSK